MLDDTTDRASFSAMMTARRMITQRLRRRLAIFKTLPDRVMAHLQMLQGDFGGFAVDRFEHSLQTATRAFKDGKDEEYVVALCCMILVICWARSTMPNWGRLSETVYFRAEPFHAAESRHFPRILFLPPYELTATPANSEDMSISNIPRNSATMIRLRLTRVVCRWRLLSQWSVR